MIAAFRALVVLSLTAASIALFGWQIWSDSASDFLRANTLAPTLRHHMLGTMLGAALATSALSGFYVLVGGSKAGDRVDRLARTICPLALLAVVPPLLQKDIWDPLTAALAIAVFTLLFEALLRISLGAMDELAGFAAPSGRSSALQRKITMGVVILAAAFYGAYMSRYTLFAHRRFQTSNFDLGQYDNVFWNALHGHPLRCTPLGAMENWSSLSSHADFGVYFLLPFYAIHPNAETLLIMQACILGLGAIPLYLFARRRLSPTASAALAICYLLYAPLHGSNFYDFHFQPIAATFVLFTIWFVESRRWIWAALFFIVAASCREDISVGLTVLGLYLVATRYRPRAGIVMAAAGLTYFVVIRFVIMPRFGQGWFSDIYKELYPQPIGPRSYSGVMQTLITNPSYVFKTLLTADKLRYFLQIFAPIAFLPMRRAYLLPALLPGMLFTLLTTAYPPTIDIAFQYSGHFTPYVFAASAVALAAYRPETSGGVRMRAALAALCVATLLSASQWGAFPPRGGIRGGFSFIPFTAPTQSQLQKGHDLVELAAMIPADAKFGVSEEEVPHVSGRLNIVAMKYGTNGADYLLYATGSNGSQVGTQALASGEYVELASRPGLTLLKRK